MDERKTELPYADRDLSVDSAEVWLAWIIALVMLSGLFLVSVAA